jgi:hypothetical protein
MSTYVHVEPASGKMLWTGRIVSGLVVAFLLFDGAIKLIPLDVVITTSQELGIPVHLARTLGVLTLVCTLLYAWPRTAVLGAILLTGYLGGAIYVQVRAGSPMLSHTLFGVYLGVLAWGGLWLREARLRALIPWQRD